VENCFEIEKMQENLMEQQKKKTVECPKCEKKFKCERGLKYHIETVIGSNKCCECSECDYKGLTTCDLVKHIKDVHEKYWNFQCSTCNKKFKNASKLQEHKKIVHKENKVHFCHFDDCEFSSNLKRNLIDHIKKVHKGKNVDNVKKFHSKVLKHFEIDRIDEVAKCLYCPAFIKFQSDSTFGVFITALNYHLQKYHEKMFYRLKKLRPKNLLLSRNQFMKRKNSRKMPT
jgi:hypothetical protein